MGVVYQRCCGLDVHKRAVVACRIVPGAGGGWQREVRTFGTVTVDVLAMADWLKGAGVTHVAMESTWVYRRPVYNVLEGQFDSIGGSHLLPVGLGAVQEGSRFSSMEATGLGATERQRAAHCRKRRIASLRVWAW